MVECFGLHFITSNHNYKLEPGNLRAACAHFTCRRLEKEREREKELPIFLKYSKCLECNEGKQKCLNTMKSAWQIRQNTVV